MLITKEICNKLSITLSDLLELCDKSKRNGDKHELSEKALKRKFSRDLKNIAEKYPDRFSWKAICISDMIKETDYELRIALIKEIFKMDIITYVKCRNVIILSTMMNTEKEICLVTTILKTITKQ